MMVVESDILFQDLPEMCLVENDHVIQAFPADGPDDPFGDGVELGGFRRSEEVFRSAVFGTLLEQRSVAAVPVSYQEPGNRIHPVNCVHELLGRPEGGGGISHVEMQDRSAVVSNEEEDVKDVEGGLRRNI